MTPAGSVFRRVEKKYLLDTAQHSELLETILPYLRPDEYGAYTIGSLYLDTPDFYSIRTSLEKPVYKEKLRLRGYGVPGAEDTVYLELKKKYKGVVYKRRIALPLTEAAAYLAQGAPPRDNGQIFREIDWYMNRYHPSPRVYIAYDRVAYTGRNDAELRITFDARIRWRKDRLDLSAGDEGKLLLPSDRILMEIKIPGVMPLWLAEALSKHALYPVSFSKYGTCFSRGLLREEDRQPTGGILSA